MNELAKIEDSQSIEIEKVWANPAEIKTLVAPSLSDSEFSYFMSMSKATGANPLLREIWAVKYGDSAAHIFHGRDFYRRKAQELEAYEGHTSAAIYSNDTFEVVNGTPHHSFNFADRGTLIGAYCVVYVRGRKVPYLEIVEFREYTTGKSLWSKKPATMIKKVAEAQGLRGAFQGVFGGTYDESEQWESTAPVQVKEAPVDEAHLEKAYTAIEALPAHSPNASMEWLGVENVRECSDFVLLRKYFAHISRQKPEPLDLSQEDLEGMLDAVSEFTPEQADAFTTSADAKDFTTCQALFDKALTVKK